MSLLRRGLERADLLAKLVETERKLGISERENRRLRLELTERDRAQDLAQVEDEETQEQAKREAETNRLTGRLLARKKLEGELAEAIAKRRKAIGL